MSIALDGDTIRLQGRCEVEEAERFLVMLQAAPGRLVDLSDVDRLHTAFVQIIMALRPPLVGGCGDPFVRDWVLDPSLAGNSTRDQVFDGKD